MNLAWIAAVLRPHDVAPHPNFTDEEYSSNPAGQLAALVIGGDWEHRSRGVDVRDEALAFAEKSLRFETLREGVDGLILHAFSGSSSDVSRSASLLLLACAAAAEMEDYKTCDSVLTELLERVDESPAGRLIQAALFQQRGLRRRDSGQPFVNDIFEAARLLEDLSISELPDFQISPGVDITATHSLGKIIYAMKRSAWSLIPSDYDQKLPFAAFPSYMERVRQPSSERLLRISADMASVYGRYSLETFKDLFDGSRSIVIGRGSPDLFHEALALELMGHSTVYYARRQLALLRLTQHAEGVGSVDIRDSLRLLRHAGATKELGIALERFRAAGPLAVLSWDARQILLRRSDRSLLRVPELMVLRASAELLASTEAEQALSAVLDSISAGGPPNLTGAWQHIAERMGSAWLAAVALANSCDQTGRIADLLLEEIESDHSANPLRDQNTAKAIEALLWDSVPEGIKGKWARWLESSDNNGHENVIEAATTALGRPSGNATFLSGVNDVAVRLNSSLGAAGVPLTDDELSRSIAVIGESLSNIRAAAAAGSFGMSSRSSADIAALLICEYESAANLWGELAEFLMDHSVPRNDRSSSLDRLARECPTMPDEIRAHFIANADNLMEEVGSAPWDDSISPYPAALRLLIAYGLLPESRTLALLAKLVGSNSSAAKRHAARTLALVAAQSRKEWIFPFALQMSHDTDVTIKGHAARALARIASEPGELSDVASQRLVQLLGREDGLLVPFYVLRELRGANTLPSQVMTAVNDLAREHPSHRVREAANSWLAERG